MMNLTEISIWWAIVFTIGVFILIAPRGKARNTYSTPCPSCGYTYKWHSKERQVLFCKKCCNIFVSRRIDLL